MNYAASGAKIASDFNKKNASYYIRRHQNPSKTQQNQKKYLKSEIAAIYFLQIKKHVRK